MKTSIKRGIKKIILIFALLIFILFLARLFSPKEIDDVSPGIFCEEEYLEKTEILWVIPNFNNTDISKNYSWCREILAMNKEIQMHGVAHQPYKEFHAEKRNEKYFSEGLAMFELCFNQTPTKFKAPQLALSSENKKMIKENFPGIKIKHYFNQLTHKVYHCSDTGLVKNKFTNIF